MHMLVFMGMCVSAQFVSHLEIAFVLYLVVITIFDCVLWLV